MKNQNNYRKYLEKILNSQEFEGCKIEQQVLSYLFEKTLSGQVPTENTIALDVFNKNAIFNPAEDSIVRVHVHTLRKKLKLYYLTEGREDEVQFEIPKRSYEIQFNSQTNEKPHLKHSPQISLFGLIVIFILISIIIGQWFYFNNPFTQSPLDYTNKIMDQPLWKGTLDNGYPNLLVLGDPFFFHASASQENTPSMFNGTTIMRVTSINSLDELNRYNESISDSSKMYYPYVPALFEKELLWSFPNLFPLLYHQKQSYKLQLASELKWSDVQNNNIIFLGITKTLGILSSLYSELKIRYDYFPHTIRIHHSPDSLETFSPRGGSTNGPRKDYVIVTKVPGPSKGNRIIMITCTDLVGVMEITELFTNIEALKDLEQQLLEAHGSVHEYIEMLFEVSSISRVGFSTQLIASFPVSKDIDFIIPPDEW